MFESFYWGLHWASRSCWNGCGHKFCFNWETLLFQISNKYKFQFFSLIHVVTRDFFSPICLQICYHFPIPFLFTINSVCRSRKDYLEHLFSKLVRVWILCDILRNPNCLEECWNLFKTLILKIWYFKAAFFQRQRVQY